MHAHTQCPSDLPLRMFVKKKSVATIKRLIKQSTHSGGDLLHPVKIYKQFRRHVVVYLPVVRSEGTHKPYEAAHKNGCYSNGDFVSDCDTYIYVCPVKR